MTWHRPHRVVLCSPNELEPESKRKTQPPGTYSCTVASLQEWRRHQATGGEKDREAQREEGERKSAKKRSPPPIPWSPPQLPPAIAAAAAAVAWWPTRRGGERSATAARTGPCVDSESEDFRTSDAIGGRGGLADMWHFWRTRNLFSLEEFR
jgi:hypothetical protein